MQIQLILYLIHPTEQHKLKTSPNASQLLISKMVLFSQIELDNSADQIFFIAQEAVDKNNSSIIKNSQNNWEGGGARLANLADPVTQDAATKASVSAITTKCLRLKLQQLLLKLLKQMQNC